MAPVFGSTVVAVNVPVAAAGTPFGFGTSAPAVSVASNLYVSLLVAAVASPTTASATTKAAASVFSISSSSFAYLGSSCGHEERIARRLARRGIPPRRTCACVVAPGRAAWLARLPAAEVGVHRWVGHDLL